MTRCKICHTETMTYVHPKMELIFHECKACGFMFKDPSHYMKLEDEKAKYDMHHNDETNRGYVNFLMNFYESSIRPHIHGKEVLDFGSGPNPVFQKLLQNEGYQVTIYDYFYAPEKTYKEKTYDCISIIEVIEHLQSPLEVLKDLKSLLKPNGIIAIMTLFYPKDKTIFNDWFYIRDKTHVSFFNHDVFKKIAKELHMDYIDTNEYRYAVLKKRDQI